MARSKSPSKPVSRSTQSAPPTVSGRWLLAAIAISVPAAAFCAWLVLCLLFWQGSWQLLYHPASAVTRTPAAVGLAFDPVGFATTDTGAPQLQGWWISAGPSARYTVVYLHGQAGNLGDTVDALARLHGVGVNILAFDYRGYGQSLFAHPSETRWRQDADWAIQYLTATRHLDPRSIVLDGSGLGANLALEAAAAHPELAGAVLESPLNDPLNGIFGDPRSRLVPARLLVSDRYDANVSAAVLRIPSLWFFQSPAGEQNGAPPDSEAFENVKAPKVRILLTASPKSKQKFTEAFTRWLDGLPKQR